MIARCSTSGGPVIMAKLEDIRDQINDILAKPEPIQDIIAETILIQMDFEEDPDGVPWEPLSDSYTRWKAHVAPGAEMGRLIGYMKDFPNMRGRATPSGNSLVIDYGVDPLAIAHAIKFTEGGIVTGTNQPPRPFYGLNALSEQRLDDHFKTLVVV